MPRSARVIVAAYNQARFLRLVLRGYLRQTTSDFALTIADDGSTDDTKALIDWARPVFEKQGIPLAYVWHEDKGFRKTRILNDAIEDSAGEPLLIFSDGDCIPPATFVEKHLAAHEPWSFHVGGCYRLSEEACEGLGEDDVDSGHFETLGTDAHRKDLRRRRRKSSWGVMLRRKNRPKMLGLNFAMDRTLLESLNGFDEQFSSWGLEDSDLRDRAMRHTPRPRVKNMYLDNDVFHIWHPVSGSGGRKTQWDYYKSKRPVRCIKGLVDETALRTAEA